MKYILLISMLLLSSCAYLGEKVTIEENGVTTTYTEDAYAQKLISEQECATSVSDLKEMAQVTYMVLEAVGKAPSLCGNSGRNYFDAKTEIAVSRHRTILGGTKAVAGVVTAVGLADAAVDLVDSVARNSGDRFNTEIGNITQSTSANGSGGTAGEAGAAGFDQTESGVESNAIVIGGQQAVAGERSAAGETAIANGDSSVVSAVEDAELKASNIAEDITKPNDQSTFDDSGEAAGNSILDF